MTKLDEIVAKEELVVDTPAREAIVTLSKGDMRKVLNILESCSLTYKEIPVEKIYDVTGRPSVQDIETIYNALTMECFKKAYQIISDLKNAKSLALDDIVRELHKCVMETAFTEQMKMFLVSRLSEIEFRLASGVNEKPQVASLVGAFIEIRSV